MKAQQLSLTVFGKEDSAWVEKSIERTGKDGIKRKKGSSFSLPKRQIMAEQTGLVGKTNKDALDSHIMDEQSVAWNEILADLVKEGRSIGLKSLRTEILANGEESIKIALRRLPIKVIKAEDIAKAWGITIEAAREIIKSNCKIVSPVTVEVDAQAKAEEAKQLPEGEKAPETPAGEPVSEAEGQVPTDHLPADPNDTSIKHGEGVTDEELERLTAPTNA